MKNNLYSPMSHLFLCFNCQVCFAIFHLYFFLIFPCFVARQLWSQSLLFFERQTNLMIFLNVTNIICFQTIVTWWQLMKELEHYSINHNKSMCIYWLKSTFFDCFANMAKMHELLWCWKIFTVAVICCKELRLCCALLCMICVHNIQGHTIHDSP